MKYCSLPFEGLYVYPNGDVRVCGWSYECIGNILEEEFEDIWHGEKARKMRESILDGSFSLCNQVACQYCANDSHLDLTEEQFKKQAVVAESPRIIDAAYDYICNHSCPSCRHEMFKADTEYLDRMKKIQEVLLPLFNKAEMVSINGNGDVFASPMVLQMLERVVPESTNFELAIQTNGVLFNEKNWNRLEKLHNSNISVVVTPNSFERMTYKYLSGGHDNLDILLENLKFMSALRESGKIRRLEISIVVQDRNFRELPTFVKRCLEEYTCDTVIIKPIFYWFALTQEEYWFKDILNPKHPYHNEYLEVLENPVFEDSKVYFWGSRNIHDAKEHPYHSYKVYFDGFAKLLNHEDAKKSLENAMLKKGYGKVGIYGVNDMSKMLFYLLNNTKIEVLGFIDRDATCSDFCGKEVQTLKNFNPDMYETILVSNYMFMENIERDLRFRNYEGKLVPYCELLD